MTAVRAVHAAVVLMLLVLSAPSAMAQGDPFVWMEAAVRGRCPCDPPFEADRPPASTVEVNPISCRLWELHLLVARLNAGKDCKDSLDLYRRGVDACRWAGVVDPGNPPWLDPFGVLEGWIIEVCPGLPFFPRPSALTPAQEWCLFEALFAYYCEAVLNQLPCGEAWLRYWVRSSACL